MSKRNHLELYEILNRHHGVDRANLQAELAAAPVPKHTALVAQTAGTSSSQQQQIRFDAPESLDDVLANALPMPESEPVAQSDAPVAPAAVEPAPLPLTETQGPPYNFQLAPPRSAAKKDEEVFGERRLQFSYDTVILGAIVVLVMFVVTFIVGAKFGSISTPEDNGGVLANDNASGTDAGASNPSGDLTRMGVNTPANNGGNVTPTPAQNTSRSTGTQPATNNAAVITPAPAAQDFYTVIVCAVYRPDAAKQGEIERFTQYLKEQNFPDVFIRKVGNYSQICTGRSVEAVSTQSSLVKRAQEINWRDPKTGSLYRGNTAFPRRIAAGS